MGIYVFSQGSLTGCQIEPDLAPPILYHLASIIMSVFQASTNPAVSANASLATLLHTADHLSTLFTQHHSSSFQSILSISSSYNQLVNLRNMPSTPATRSRPEGGMKERGMVKVQEVIEVSSCSGLLFRCLLKYLNGLFTNAGGCCSCSRRFVQDVSGTCVGAHS